MRAVAHLREHVDRQVSLDPFPHVAQRGVPEWPALFPVDEQRWRLHRWKLSEPELLHPTKAHPERQAALFLEMAGRLNSLREAPVFYNTLTNNCTTNLVRHWEQITSSAVPLDLRWILSGYADEFAYDLGLLDTDTDFDETRLRNRISAKALACGGADDFSLCVRR